MTNEMSQIEANVNELFMVETNHCDRYRYINMLMGIRNWNWVFITSLFLASPLQLPVSMPKLTATMSKSSNYCTTRDLNS